MNTELTAVFLVAAELARQGYDVALTHGHTQFDLMVVHRTSGQQFCIEVRGLAQPADWFGQPRNALPNRPLFYALAVVGGQRGCERFFILSEHEFNILVAQYHQMHPNQQAPNGCRWQDVYPYENHWHTLPGW